MSEDVGTIRAILVCQWCEHAAEFYVTADAWRDGKSGIECAECGRAGPFEVGGDGQVKFDGVAPSQVDLTPFESVTYRVDGDYEPPEGHEPVGGDKFIVDGGADIPDGCELVDAVHREAADAAEAKRQLPTWDDVRGWFESEENDSTTRGYSAAADILCHEYAFVAIRESDALYFYDPERGHYVRKGQTFVHELLERHIPDSLNESRKRNIREKVRDRNHIASEDFRPPKGKVNLANGVLDLDTRELEPHSPEYYFTSRVRAEWPADGTVDTEAVGTWLEALADVTDDPNERRKIEEFIGYCLETWHHDREKNLFFVGPRLSGKSTIQEAIEALFGSHPTVTNLTPQQIADTKFDAAALREAALNTVNDINSRKIEDTGTLKRVFSGERMKLENKYEDAHFAAPKAKHLFTANWLPRLVGQDDAVYRRILLVEFTKTIEDHEKDREYKKRLKSDAVRQVILKRAVDARDKLHEQDGFTNDRSPDETRQLWDSWRDGHKRFLYSQFHITGDPDDEVDREAYWRAYREFAARKGYEMMSNRAITNSLQWVPEVYATGQSDTYGGLKWRDIDAADPTDATQQALPTQEEKVKRVRRLIRSAEGSDPADRQAVIEAAAEDGIDADDAEHIIENLLANGQLVEPATGALRSVSQG